MAEAGQRFEMVDGSTYVVVEPTVKTGGEYVEMEFVLPDGCVPPPPHIHPGQVEEYDVLEGRLDVVIDGEWTTLAEGEKASVPVGALHTFRNSTGGTVRVRNWHRPALRFEEYIETVHDSIEAAGINSKYDPRVLFYISRVMMDYEETLYPGRRRERIPMKAMAAVARLFGSSS